MSHRQNWLLHFVRRMSSQMKSPKPTKAPAQTPPPAAGIDANVQGLSNSIVKKVTTPVGPGAAPNADYKVPEYFCYNRFSFAEAEVEMAKFRCPQPSALKNN